MDERPPQNVAALRVAAEALERYDWVICSSARAVKAIEATRSAPWPRAVRTAAVGARTAAALSRVGADPPPLTAADGGAEALVTALSGLEWKDRRVLLPTVPGGRSVLSRWLRDAGAIVEEVEAYRMSPRSPERILADWTSARPDAAIVASPLTAATLVDAVGSSSLCALKVVVAIGAATSAALTAAGVPHGVSPRADFGEAARLLAKLGES